MLLVSFYEVRKQVVEIGAQSLHEFWCPEMTVTWVFCPACLAWDSSAVDVQSTSPVDFSSRSETTLAHKSGTQEENAVVITCMITMSSGVKTTNMMFSSIVLSQGKRKPGQRILVQPRTTITATGRPKAMSSMICTTGDTSTKINVAQHYQLPPYCSAF